MTDSLIEGMRYAISCRIGVVPSPKSQKRLVIVPVDESVKLTVKGLNPLIGVPEKLATGIIAPTPTTELMLSPALPVEITTALEKAPALPGAKRTIRLVEPKPGNVNGVPLRIVNGPGVKLAEPLVIGAPPRLVTVKLACTFEPTATVLKSRLSGITANCGGVNPTPLTTFVLLPPLLTNITALLNVPALTGQN